EEHRAEHAIRHANVLDEVAAQEDIAGSFGWCMFDYNTHKDFGSGDRICYHGVMDMFRNPKLAAAVYAIQQEEHPVLEISSSMDIGEHPGCNRGDIYILTNADSVKMYKNDKFVKEFFAKDTKFKNLKHAPILLDDYIGDALEIGENMSHKQAEDLKQILNETARVGLYNLSKTMYLKAMKLVARYHMNMTDAVELYNRYIGDWGGTSTVYRFDAVKDGEVVKTVYRQPMKKVYIKADIDHTELSENNTYDVAAVRITAADEYGNILNFFNDPICLSVEGPVELIGPSIMSLSGGMGGTYIKTTGKTGEAKLTISSGQAETVTIDITII
ncbi:MAG: glycoside hydrolase family 2 protein, partial [Lachnospiraceae bacterium]|nr:glycoside hydrolase family 2 protein [Lachnospiraceae bacterium]